MWKITKESSSETIFVNGYMDVNSAKFEKVCFTNNPEIANHFMHKSGYVVEEVKMIPVKK